MKKIITILSFFLFGCATHQYDPVEYNYSIITSVAATRAIHQCPNMEMDLFKKYIKDLNDATMHLQEYEKYSKNNENTYVGATKLRQIVIELVTRDSYSETYCKHKLSEIQSASRVLAKAFGKQGNLDLCFSDVKTRYSMYRDSYIDGNITKDEFDDLIDDLVDLAHIDNHGCSIQEKTEIENLINTISKISSTGLF